MGMEDLLHLAIALSIGVIVGLERGWSSRDTSTGGRIAGLRTFSLLGLLGGVTAIASREYGVYFSGIALLSVTILMAVAYVRRNSVTGDVGVTTLVAALLVFILAMLVFEGYMLVSVALAVATAFILSLKSRLHYYLEQLQQNELDATLHLLLITLVLLPLLPDRGFGPWQALNPFYLWLMVVLISGISFVGYFAIRIIGAHVGIMLTSLFGGLIASTALTLYLSKLSHKFRNGKLLAAGVMISSATMFPRIMVEISVVNSSLLQVVWPPLLLMAVISYGYAYILWRTVDKSTGIDFKPSNPFELTTAIKYALLLVVIFIATLAARQWYGETGIYVVTALSAILDVDAITISLSSMQQFQFDSVFISKAIVLAACVNTVAKGVLAMLIGSRAYFRWVLSGMALTVLVGVVTTWQTI